MFPHGAQKLLGWFGGGGFSGTMQFFSSMGIPSVFGFLAIVAEFFGAIGLIVGLMGRIAALGVASVMLVAVMRIHIKVGFFMNWSGAQAGEGYEYHLLALGCAIAVMIKGSGAFSADRMLSK